MRETFRSSSWLGGELLKGLGASPDDADQAVAIFRGHDEEKLRQQYPFRNDRDALIQSSHEAARELRELFAWDAADRDTLSWEEASPVEPPPNDATEDDQRD